MVAVVGGNELILNHESGQVDELLLVMISCIFDSARARVPWAIQTPYSSFTGCSEHDSCIALHQDDHLSPYLSFSVLPWLSGAIFESIHPQQESHPRLILTCCGLLPPQIMDTTSHLDEAQSGFDHSRSTRKVGESWMNNSWFIWSTRFHILQATLNFAFETPRHWKSEDNTLW